ncbi:MAG: hypothetical protein ACI9J4_001289 [Paraglaciecola sp.]|jgi:hypothetical protein
MLNKKLLPLIPIAFAFSASAEQLTYESIANRLSLSNNGIVQVKIMLREEDDVISCSQGTYDFTFAIDSIVGQKWYDTLALSRTTNTLVDFQYDDSNCAISVISYAEAYADGDDGNVGNETPGGGMVTTGDNGNVALLGTNGLIEASYSASSSYRQDTYLAAFDGYIYGKTINEDATDKISRGIWIAENRDSAGDKVEPWLQIDFGEVVTLAGMRTLVNDKSVELGRSPRDIILLTSEDGEEFVEHENYRLPLQSVVDGGFSSALSTRYLRLQVVNNYGDAKFIEIDEWELYQD